MQLSEHWELISVLDFDQDQSSLEHVSLSSLNRHEHQRTQDEHGHTLDFWCSAQTATAAFLVFFSFY